MSAPGQCAVDWTQAGIPGGIPTNWTQSGSTIQASACGNGSSDCTSTIQTALNSCGGSSLPGKYVLLGAGTFLIDGNVAITNYCYLAGSGPQSTILNCMGTSGSCVRMGVYNDAPGTGGTCTVTGGNTAGSSSLALSALDLGSYACPASAGNYLVISELNNPVFVSSTSPQNPGGCPYCDAFWSGTRLREQTVEVTSVGGSGPYTVGITPALYTDYGTATGTGPVYAQTFTPDCKYCGAQNFQLYANGTGLGSGMSDMLMSLCAYCFVQNVEFNYTDADWLDLNWCYRCEVRNNYFSNAFAHSAGGSDADLALRLETSASLVINNILERGHASIMVNGASGNVIAYNYAIGAYNATGGGFNETMLDEHGAYPQFNLFEGNVGDTFAPDSWHGNSGYETAFRNWLRGADTWAFYPALAITSITCSGGTCTINLSGSNTYMYAGEYVRIWGTSSGSCGSGAPPGYTAQTVQLTGTAGSLSNTFSAGSCSGATGGYVAVTDLVGAPMPITHQPVNWTSSNTLATYQTLWEVDIPAFVTNVNLIGNVLGSDQQTATVGASYMYKSGASPCMSCLRAPTARSYYGVGSGGGAGYASTFDYDTSGDGSGSPWTTFPGGPSGVNGYWSNQGFNTTFYHGNYDSASASTIWNVNATGGKTLPASFFLSAAPSWFGSVPWPPIGPDVTGGPDTATAGHANYIPAQVCYNSLSRDSLGIKMFDANTCYTPFATLVPPTNVLMAIH